jgi:mannose/fructose/N-acetylgalactosamine-specific phosphotransferase system component IIB
MKILLARIDDRFIHGQVTVGWSQKLRPDRIILANNEIAADPWQSRVYSSSVPPEIQVSILGTSQTAAQLIGPTGPFAAQETCILLAGTTRDMHFIHRHGLSFSEVNLGGMHHAPGKREMLPYLYVDQEDLTLFRSFLDGGTRLFGQQVPGGKETEVDLPMIQELEAQF